MCEVIFGRIFNFQQQLKKTRRFVLSEKLVIVGTQNKAYQNEFILDLCAWLSHNASSNIGLRKTELTCEIGISAFHEGNYMCEVIFGRIFNFQQRFQKNSSISFVRKFSSG